MRKLSGPDWFDQRYRRKNEGRCAALTRLSVESGLQIKTLYRACVHGLAVRASTAHALGGVKGGSSLDTASLVLVKGKRK